MSKIAVFFADGFEEIEALTVVDICRRAEIETDVVRVPAKDAENCGCGHRVTGSHGIALRADSLLEEVDFDALDMIVLPGGMPGTKNLESCEALTEQIRRFDKAERRIAAICAAPGILGRMGLLAGRKAVSHPSAEEALSGAEIPQGEEVVVSGHIITSRGMGTAMAFALKIVELLEGKEKADAIAQAICYRA